MKTIIIARCGENLEWLDNISPLHNIKIYNKGGQIDNNCEILPNVGRESHSYLKYIVDNYNELDGVYCFIQGNPFDHCSNHTKETLIEFINSTDNCDEFTAVSGIFYICDKYGYPHHPDLNVGEYANIHNIEIPESIKFTPGAQFIVNSRDIKKRPLEFYNKLLLSVSGDWNPPGAYILERLWFYIFNN